MYTTFIIQGPLTKDSIRCIQMYSQFGNVIVSHWNTDNSTLIQAAYNEASSAQNVEIVTNAFVKDNSYNCGNMNFHLQSFRAGLEKCKTDSAIKVRSDEYMTDPRKLMNEVKKNPNKMTVCNFLFRGDFVLHPSDHIMGGNTKDMLSMVGRCMDTVAKYRKGQRVGIDSLGLSSDYCYEILIPETLFCVSWLKVKGVDITDNFRGKGLPEIESINRYMMKKYYNLVRASDLGDFLFRFTSAPIGSPTAYTDESAFLYGTGRCHIRCIGDFDDIYISKLRDEERPS